MRADAVDDGLDGGNGESAEIGNAWSTPPLSGQGLGSEYLKSSELQVSGRGHNASEAGQTHLNLWKVMDTLTVGFAAARPSLTSAPLPHAWAAASTIMTMPHLQRRGSCMSLGYADLSKSMQLRNYGSG